MPSATVNCIQFAFTAKEAFQLFHSYSPVFKEPEIHKQNEKNPAIFSAFRFLTTLYPGNMWS